MRSPILALLGVLFFVACSSSVPLGDGGPGAPPTDGGTAIGDLAPDAATLAPDAATLAPDGAVAPPDAATDGPGHAVSDAAMAPPDFAGTSTIPPYPGVTTTKVDDGAALALRVASDEAHVLVQRTLTTSGSLAYEQGGLAVVTIGSGGSGQARELSSGVDLVNGFPQADFTTDAKALYFVDTSQSPGRLVLASADGSGARTVATGGIRVYPTNGDTLVYTLIPPGDQTGYESVYAVALPSGNPVDLADALDFPSVQPSPSGSAVLLGDDTSHTFQIVQTATGAKTTLGTGSPQVAGGYWTADGARLVYWLVDTGGVTIHVIGSDGKGDQVLTTSAGTTPELSPDGKRVAWGELASGQGYGSGALADIRIHPLDGGADVVLTLDTKLTWGGMTFSPDGKVAWAKSGAVLAAAPASQSGAFVELLTNLDPYGEDPPTLAPSDDHLAIPVTGGKVAVAAIAGGSRDLAVPADNLPWYEPVATTPRLLAFTPTDGYESGIPGTLMIFPTDGSGAGIDLPGEVFSDYTELQAIHTGPFGWSQSNGGATGEGNQPFTWGWLGSEIVYEANHGENNVPDWDVVAATDDGGTVGVIAPGASVWAVRDGAVPTRLFFGRASESGLWMSPVPQTPGR